MSYFEKKFSRRKIIKFMAVGATFPIVNSVIGQARAEKASKELMKYRNESNGKEQCSNCIQFIPGKTIESEGECKVVEGNISPKGWCTAYAKKT